MNKDDEHPLFRVSLLPYVGMACKICGHEYISIDDILERNPVRADEEFNLACEKCWNTEHEI